MTKKKAKGRTVPRTRAAQPKARYFDMHQHFRWHADWEVIEIARLARHVSGVIYDFSPGTSGALSAPYGLTCQSAAWHGKLRPETAGRLSTSPVRAERICMEACQLFDEAAMFLCHGCNADTMMTDYYMVDDALWVKAQPQVYGMLCMSCLENLIGRPLVAADFPPLPINATNEKVQAIRRRDKASAARPVPIGEGSNTVNDATALCADLRKAAAALRIGTVDLNLAERLASLATALESPMEVAARNSGQPPGQSRPAAVTALASGQ